MISFRPVAALALALMVVAPSNAAAHEIPASVTVHVFVKPEGDRLRVIARAPVAAMRDVDLPTRGPGYLDVARARTALAGAATIWIAGSLRVYEGETPLPSPRIAALRVSLPSDRSFGSYDEALVHVTSAGPTDATDLYWSQGLLDVLFEYPIRSDRSDFSIDPGLARLGIRVVTVVRFVPLGSAVRAFEFTGDPGLVRLDPRWSQAALHFVKAGFFHILDGIDHLLFLLCLVIPFRRVIPLVAVITAFTVAHSITLIASAFGLAPGALWFPPLIETLIAMSIVYMALENIVGARLRRRWLIAFGFGLVHGFGFAFALGDSLQFAGSQLLTALLSFNVGVEIGQLLVLALLIPMLALLFRFVVSERIGTIVLSALVAHTAWHWMVERGDRLRQFRFVWPSLDAALLATAMRWTMVMLVLAGVGWLLFSVFRRARSAPASARSSSPSARSRRPAAGSS